MIMRLYEYISDDDRGIILCESVADHKLKLLDFQLNKVAIEHEINKLQIETKVLLENGTDDDLTQLYIAEAEEVTKKKTGLLSKICGVIASIFQKIREWLFGKKLNISDDSPDQIEVPAGPKATGNVISRALQNIGKVVSNANTLKKVAAAGAVVVGTGYGIVKGSGLLDSKTIIPKEEYQKALDAYAKQAKKTEEDIKRVQKELNNASSSNAPENVVNSLKKELDTLKAAAKSIRESSSLIIQGNKLDKKNSKDKQKTPMEQIKEVESKYYDIMKNAKEKIKDSPSGSLKRKGLSAALTSQLKKLRKAAYMVDTTDNKDKKKVLSLVKDIDKSLQYAQKMVND